MYTCKKTSEVLLWLRDLFWLEHKDSVLIFVSFDKSLYISTDIAALLETIHVFNIATPFNFSRYCNRLVITHPLLKIYLFFCEIIIKQITERVHYYNVYLEQFIGG